MPRAKPVVSLAPAPIMASTLAPPAKRRKRSTALVEDDVEAAAAVTHETVSHVTRSGTKRTKTVLVPLVPVIDKPENPSRAAVPHDNYIDFQGNYEIPDYEHNPLPKTNKVDTVIIKSMYDIFMQQYTKTQRDYVQQFVDRVSDLLQATLARETLPEGLQTCWECSQGTRAIWRCIDCTLSHTLCRHCMRHTHRQSPFHRIECWTGSYFRRAALWEVGAYILVEHHTNVPVCEGLKFQMEFLERLQLKRDKEEDDKIARMHAAPGSGSSGHRARDGVDVPVADFNAEWGENKEDWEHGGMSDADFFHWLDICHENRGQSDVGHDEFMDGEDMDNGEMAEADIEGFAPYLEPPIGRRGSDAEPDGMPGADPDPGAVADIVHATAPVRPQADALNNTYVRIVHTNGIHHLAMVTCLCHGEPNVALDLVASRLLPASFTRIRTLFTTPLLDYFRLCNLELKASAYQFYQLICRLTIPLGIPALVNLYHEFRRMSQLWHWMKKLKWAGYGHNQKDPLQPPPGSLANYCLTCPQPGVNLPRDWKNDRNRSVMCSF